MFTLMILLIAVSIAFRAYDLCLRLTYFIYSLCIMGQIYFDSFPKVLNKLFYLSDINIHILYPIFTFEQAVAILLWLYYISKAYPQPKSS